MFYCAPFTHTHTRARALDSHILWLVYPRRLSRYWRAVDKCATFASVCVCVQVFVSARAHTADPYISVRGLTSNCEIVLRVRKHCSSTHAKVISSCTIECDCVHIHPDKTSSHHDVRRPQPADTPLTHTYHQPPPPKTFVTGRMCVKSHTHTHPATRLFMSGKKNNILQPFAMQQKKQATKCHE